MQVLVNLFVLLVEVGVIACIVAVALFQPIIFAGVTAMLILVIGLRLEWQRLRHELGFFFDDGRATRVVFVSLAACVEACVKAIAAGGASILAFAGSDTDRLLVVAVVFAASLFAGAGMLRRSYYSFGVRPMRWGYFRLAIPLGVLFSIGMYAAVLANFIEVLSLRELAGALVFELPERPNLSQLSEFAFSVKQTIDAVLVNFAEQFLGPSFAWVAGILLSVNVLTGFALAIYVVLISEVVLRLEGRERPKR